MGNAAFVSNMKNLEASVELVKKQARLSKHLMSQQNTHDSRVRNISPAEYAAMVIWITMRDSTHRTMSGRKGIEMIMSGQKGCTDN